MGATADRKLAKMIESRGLNFGPTIIREANRTGLPLALALALVEQDLIERPGPSSSAA